ncbi:MAG TPA: bacteriocin fulvocin C-related protein [Moheibacter sp.]|nr:bacteriocin fulvocin C-related protein [Moheibacter sp.]
MRNLFLKLVGLLFGMLILVSSCASDDISIEQLKVTENFNYQKFYDDYKNEIQNLDREEFAGLNTGLRILSYENLSNQKKYDLWHDKIQNTLKIKSLSEEQKLFLLDVKKMIGPIIFDRSNNEEMLKIIDIVEKKGMDLFENDLIINNIFGELGSLDEDLNLKNIVDEKNLMSEQTFKAIGLSSSFSFVEYEGDGLNPGTEPWCDLPNCTTRDCILCNPTTYSDCTNSCCRQSGCGILFAQTCIRRCLY